MNIKSVMTYMHDVSPWVFASKSIRSMTYGSDSKMAWAINRWNERIVTNYLRGQVKDDGDMDFPSLLGKPAEGVPPESIFIMWWQGEKNAPPLVKACIDSVRRHAHGHKVIVISEDNVGQYVHIPDFVLDKVNGGGISFTHLSDIIRLNLLTLYGGAWIDSTVYCVKDIPESLFAKPFYSIHFGRYTKDPSHGRWTTFLMFAAKGNGIVSRTLKYHYIYWLKHNVVADYIMFDYFINQVITEDEGLKRQVDAIPVENKDVFLLLQHLDDEGFDLEDFVARHDTIFYKLSWKRKFKNYDHVVRMLRGEH